VDIFLHDTGPPADCNQNGIPDDEDIANGTSQDCDGNQVPDECDPDCDLNGLPDACDIAGDPATFDCDSDGLLDSCEIAADPSLDQNGNGVLDSCECEVQNTCTALANSTGAPADIDWTGSLHIDDDLFALTVSSAPPQQFGLFFYGPAEQASPPMVGDGLLCVGAGGLGLFRLNPAAVTSDTGSLARVIHFADPPTGSGPGQVDPGDTWHFQFWFRDPVGGPAGFNFSDALRVTFCP
jgi:hypothetical protein